MLVDFVKSSRIQGAVQDTYALLQYARSDALRTGEDRFVVWDENGGNWCAAVAAANDCDCLTEDCSIDGVLRQINSTDYQNVNFSSTFTGDYTRFDGLRGLAEGHAGTVSYQIMDGAAVDYESRVVVSVLGRIRLCSATGSSGGYSPC